MLRHQPEERPRRPQRSVQRHGWWSIGLSVKGPGPGTFDVQFPSEPSQNDRRLTWFDCLFVQRSSPCSSQKSSRNDYMKSGLYSTFTIQSLQTQPQPRPVKPEHLIQQDPGPKAECPSRDVSDTMFLFWVKKRMDWLVAG